MFIYAVVKDPDRQTCIQRNAKASFTAQLSCVFHSYLGIVLGRTMRLLVLALQLLTNFLCAVY